MKVIVDGKEMEVTNLSVVFEDMSPERESISFNFEESGSTTSLATTILDFNLDVVRVKLQEVEEIYDDLSLEEDDDTVLDDEEYDA